MSAMNPVDLAQAASSLLFNPIPVFGIAFGISLLIGLITYMRQRLNTMDYPPYDDDQDEMPIKKPKNKAVGMNADGEIVYSEPAETPLFYPNDHLG